MSKTILNRRKNQNAKLSITANSRTDRNAKVKVAITPKNVVGRYGRMSISDFVTRQYPKRQKAVERWEIIQNQIKVKSFMYRFANRQLGSQPVLANLQYAGMYADLELRMSESLHRILQCMTHYQWPQTQAIKMQFKRRRSVYGMHVLYLRACRFGNLKVVQKCIKDKRIDINFTLQNKNGALHEAVMGKHYTIIDELLQEESIDFDYPNEDGMTPVMIAASLKLYYVVFLLILRGADTEYRGANKTHRNVRDWAFQDPFTRRVLKEAEQLRPNDLAPQTGSELIKLHENPMGLYFEYERRKSMLARDARIRRSRSVQVVSSPRRRKRSKNTKYADRMRRINSFVVRKRLAVTAQRYETMI